jgi:hypothetical protein
MVIQCRCVDYLEGKVFCGFVLVIAQGDTSTNRQEGEEGGLTPLTDM